MSWEAWAVQERDTIAAAGRWRVLRAFDTSGAVTGHIAGRDVVSFASNDYLGLSAHPLVLSAAREALDRWGAGARSARLIVGTRPIHEQLEAALATWKQTEAALLFPTGYMANLGAITAFAGPGIRVLSDALNHASIIDACGLSRAEVQVYPHRDLHAVEALLRVPGRTMVVSETVFSMDGDVAPVDEMVKLCQRYGALLVLDEAHAVLGPELTAVDGDILLVGTLSKTLGSVGGFVAGPSCLVELIVNRARSFIFTTALAPSSAAAALAAVELLQDETGEELRCRLRVLINRVRPGHPSPIIPVVLGAEEAALEAAQKLLDRGILIPAIRPPTVPAGTSRLRISLSAAHTDAQVEALLAALRDTAGTRVEA